MRALHLLRNGRRLAAVGLAMTAVSALLPPPAEAGRYRVYSCRTPTGAVAPADGWTAEGHADWSNLVNRCSSGGPLQALLSGAVEQPAGASIGWRFRAPAATTIHGYRLWRSATTASGRDYGTPLYRLNRGHPSYNAASVVEQCRDGCALGSHASATARGNEREESGLDDVRDLWLLAECGGGRGGSCPAASGPIVELRLHGAEILLEDPHDPTASTPSGALVRDGAHRGTEGISFRAEDVGAGVYRARIEVDGRVVREQVVDDNGGRCADAGANADSPYEFLSRVPCKPSAGVALELDTRELADGEHRLRVRVEDAAGNVATAHAPDAFLVDNVPPPQAATPPSVEGRPEVGGTLVADLGSWSGEGNEYALAWLRCDAEGEACRDIPGADRRAYEVTGADVGRRLRVRVMARNREGEGTATSAPTSVVPAPPAPPASPAGPPAPASSGGPAPAPSRSDEPPAAPRRFRLDVAWSRTGSSIAASAWGRKTGLRGRLTDEQGRPVADAAIDVLHRVEGTAYDRAEGAVRTHRDGTFALTLPGDLSSRAIVLSYRPPGTDASEAVTRTLTLTVAARSSLRIRPSTVRNGRRVVFSGRVLSRPLPSAGVPVALQVRVAGRWVTFAVVRANGHGLWQRTYRFRRTYRPTSYAFRAVVLPAGGYPFAAGSSRVARVHVR